MKYLQNMDLKKNLLISWLLFLNILIKRKRKSDTVEDLELRAKVLKEQSKNKKTTGRNEKAKTGLDPNH